MPTCTPSRGKPPFLALPLNQIKLLDSSIGVRARYTLVPSPSTARLLREKGWGNLRVMGRGVDGRVFSVSLFVFFPSYHVSFSIPLFINSTCYLPFARFRSLLAFDLDARLSSFFIY
jgi:hypothetical protein